MHVAIHLSGFDCNDNDIYICAMTVHFSCHKLVMYSKIADIC